MPVRPVATSSRIDVRWEQAALGGSMFEKYTEKARRVIFFARYECSADGSPAIESHHLLIGLILRSIWTRWRTKKRFVRKSPNSRPSRNQDRRYPRVSTLRSARSASTFLPSPPKRPSASGRSEERR